MTTFNLRIKRGSDDLAGQAVSTVQSTTGKTPATSKVTVEYGEDHERGMDRLDVDVTPYNVEPHRGGTRGVGRGAQRGAF